MDEAKAWQLRPMDALYPIVYLDCIHVKSRDAGAVKVKAVYLALGIGLTGNKQLLGLWIGGPDKRFKGNKELPICRYEEVTLLSQSGLNEVVQLSRCGVGGGFAKAISLLGKSMPKDGTPSDAFRRADTLG